MGKQMIGVDRVTVRGEGDSVSAGDVAIKRRGELRNYDDKMRIKKLAISWDYRTVFKFDIWVTSTVVIWFKASML